MITTEAVALLRQNIALLDAFLNGPVDGSVQLRDATIGTLQGLTGSTAGPVEPPVTWPGRHWYDTSGPAPVLRVRNTTNTAWIAVLVEELVDGSGLVTPTDAAVPRPLIERLGDRLHVRDFGVVPDSRAAAAANRAALQAAIDAAVARRKVLDLGGGVIFVEGRIRIGGACKINGLGGGYWPEQPVGVRPLSNLSIVQAPTQLVFVGVGARDLTVAGISSMQGCGGWVANPSARTGFNDAHYRLSSFVAGGALRPFSAAILVQGRGVTIEGVRILADFGGGDGQDGYETASAPDWSDGDYDFGIYNDAEDRLNLADVAVVGHWRMAGLGLIAIRMDLASPWPGSIYRCSLRDCTFQGYRGVLARGADVWRVIAVSGSYIEIPYADDHPFTPEVFGTVRKATGHTASAAIGQTIQSVAQVADRLRITFTGPVSGVFAPGDQIVTRGVGGANSHRHFRDCTWMGIHHSSGKPAHDQSLPQPFAAPSAAYEESGWRSTEVYGDGCKIQTAEEVGLHLHACTNLEFPGLQAESVAAVDGQNRLRMIASPSEAENDRVPYPAGQTFRLLYSKWGNFSDERVDDRPMVPLVSAAFTGGGDLGLFRANQPSSPAYHGSACVQGAFVRPSPGQAAGIKAAGAPFSANMFVYDDAVGALIQSAPVRNDARAWIEAVAVGGGGTFEIIDGREVQLTIPDNAAATITLSGVIVGSPFAVAGNTQARGVAFGMLRASSSGPFVAVAASSISAGAVAGAAGALAGTTGADGNLTIGAANAAVYVENRTGAEGVYLLTLL